jgi:hypothetical protein
MPHPGAADGHRSKPRKVFTYADAYDALAEQEEQLACDVVRFNLKLFGSFAMFTAIRRASLRVTKVIAPVRAAK